MFNTYFNDYNYDVPLDDLLAVANEDAANWQEDLEAELLSEFESRGYPLMRSSAAAYDMIIYWELYNGMSAAEAVDLFEASNES